MITRPGDVLVIHHRGQPSGYGRVEEILADVKPGWWQLSLTLLQLPPVAVTWILREEYIDGQEFTMGGEPLRLERLAPAKAVNAPEPSPPESGPRPKDDEAGKVISLSQRKKERDQ